MNKKHGNLGSALLPVGASFIWGVSFAAQSAGMDYIGPFTFSAVRCAIAALVLIPVFLLFDRTGLTPAHADRKRTVKAGLLLGCVLFVASNLQQLGLIYTTVAKSGFITSLYIVLVPLAGMLFFRRKIPPVLFFCIPLAVVGLYFLALKPGDFRINRGDVYTLLCSLVFTMHILTVDHFAESVDLVRASCIQFAVVSILSAVPMALFETPSLPAIGAAWLPLVYSGALSGGIAYTMQMLAQRRIEPAALTLLLSPEAVFAALAGWVLLGEALTGRELLGCALVFSAAVLSEIPWDRLKKPRAANTAAPKL